MCEHFRDLHKLIFWKSERKRSDAVCEHAGELSAPPPKSLAVGQNMNQEDLNVSFLSANRNCCLVIT